MLQNTIKDFIKYCNIHNFSKRSQNIFRIKLLKFNNFLNAIGLKNIHEVKYSHLTQFIIHNNPSVHTKKPGVWTLRQFFHYLKIKGIVKENIANVLPYPKINVKEPEFFSIKELKQILDHFIGNSDSYLGMRNLIIILFLSFLGLRISTIINLNVQDIDFKASNLLVREKGNKIRLLPLPQIICFFLYPYIKALDHDLGPLLLSQRNKRISTRMVQHIFQKASRELGFHIHSHRFRHTAETHLNQVSGIEVTQEVLGHRRRKNTEKYIHLNPSVYVEYMQRHPYMEIDL